jgi:hypothetical protein
MTPEQLKEIQKVLKGFYFDPLANNQYDLFHYHYDSMKSGFELPSYVTKGVQIFCYAAEGEHEEVTKLLETLKGTADYQEGINLAAQGYAYGQHHDKVEEYRLLGAEHTSIAVGYARSKNDEKVEQYQEKADKAAIVVAYVLAEDPKKAKEYQDAHKIKDCWFALARSFLYKKLYPDEYKDNPEAYTFIAFGSGLLYDIEANFHSLKITDFATQEAKDAFGQGCVLSGHLARHGMNEVTTLKMWGASEQATLGAQSLKKKDSKPQPAPKPVPVPEPEPTPEPVPAPEPEPVPEPVPTPEPVPAPEPEPAPEPVPAPELTQAEKLEQIVLKYLAMRKEEREYPEGPTKQYLRYSPFHLFQKSFKQKSEAIVSLLDTLKEKPGIDLKKHLSTLQDGRLGKQLREFIKSGQANQIVGQPVSTVKDFVNALHQRSNQNKPSSQI